MGGAFHNYAVDSDNQLHQEKIDSITGRNPWDVSTQFTDDMIDYGMTTPQSWFCPADPTHAEHARSYGTTIGANDVMGDLEDMKLYFTRGSLSWHVLPLTYFVPRPDRSQMFPTIDGTTAHPDGWPTGIEDRRAAIKPVLADMIPVTQSLGPADPDNATEGGHRRSNNHIESATRLYADGHVEVVPDIEIEARSGPGITQHGNWYTFY